MKKFFVLGLGLVTLCQTCFSWADTTQEVLENLYNSATIPASADDLSVYSQYGDPLELRKNCEYLYADIFLGLKIGTHTRKSLGHGPLFPEKEVTKLYFGPGMGFYQTESMTTATDLIITNPYYEDRVDSNTGEIRKYGAQVFARKAGDYVAFKFVVATESPRTVFGYCYHPEG